MAMVGAHLVAWFYCHARCSFLDLVLFGSYFVPLLFRNFSVPFLLLVAYLLLYKNRFMKSDTD